MKVLSILNCRKRSARFPEFNRMGLGFHAHLLEDHEWDSGIRRGPSHLLSPRACRALHDQISPNYFMPPIVVAIVARAGLHDTAHHK